MAIACASSSSSRQQAPSSNNVSGDFAIERLGLSPRLRHVAALQRLPRRLDPGIAPLACRLVFFARRPIRVAIALSYEISVGRVRQHCQRRAHVRGRDVAGPSGVLGAADRGRHFHDVRAEERKRRADSRRSARARTRATGRSARARRSKGPPRCRWRRCRSTDRRAGCPALCRCRMTSSITAPPRARTSSAQNCRTPSVDSQCSFVRDDVRTPTCTSRPPRPTSSLA